MKKTYVKQIVKMLTDEWDLGKRSSCAKGDICGYIYLYDVLKESDEIVLYEDNGKVIGICGYTKYNSKRHMLRKMYYSLLQNICINSSKIKYKDKLDDYYNNYDYSPAQLKNNVDGEISLLIVDKDYRNKGIGKKILNDIFKVAKENGLKKLQILSDESCDYSFYESIGCKKIYEKLIENKEDESSFDEIGYVYIKEL